MNDETQTLSIGQVARLAGVKTSAIRYYESIGVLPPPARESGHRRYGAPLRELAGRKLPEVDALIERAQAMRSWLSTATGCTCPTLDVCALFDPDRAAQGLDGSFRSPCTGGLRRWSAEHGSRRLVV